MCISSAALFDLCEDVVHDVTDAAVERELKNLNHPSHAHWGGGQKTHVLAVGPIVLSAIMRLPPSVQRKFMVLASKAASVIFYRYRVSAQT